MLDIIRNSIRYEISSIAELGITTILRDAVSNGNLASQYQRHEKRLNKYLEKFLDAYSGNE